MRSKKNNWKVRGNQYSIRGTKKNSHGVSTDGKCCRSFDRARRRQDGVCFQVGASRLVGVVRQAPVDGGRIEFTVRRLLKAD